MRATVRKWHEWRLAAEYTDALRAEDYETCAVIRDEVRRRVAAGTINRLLVAEAKRSRALRGVPIFDEVEV